MVSPVLTPTNAIGSGDLRSASAGFFFSVLRLAATLDPFERSHALWKLHKASYLINLYESFVNDNSDELCFNPRQGFQHFMLNKTGGSIGSWC